MAGERYGSVGAAAGAGWEDFLYNQAALDHQHLMDSMSIRKEARQEQQDKLELELRREELFDRREERKHVHDKDERKSIREDIGDMAPGDVPAESLVARAKAAGVPLRLGATPTIPGGQAQVAMPQSGIPSEVGGPAPTMAAMPGAQPAQSFPTAKPFAGTPEQQSRNDFANVIEKETDPKKIAAQAIRMGVKITPQEAGAFGMSTGRATALQSFVAKGPDGKVLPGVVSSNNGVPLLNGQPLPQGVTVSKLDTSGAMGPIEPGTPAYQMAVDVANGKMTYEQMLKSYSFQRSGREEARQIYFLARQMNPGLNPLSINADLHAYTGELTKLRGMQGNIESFAKTADENAKLLDGLIDKIPETGFSGKPDEWARQVSKFLGDTDVPKFNTLIFSLQNEYARLNTTMQGTGVVSDSAREDLKKMLDNGATREQLRGVLATLKTESANRRTGLDKEIQNVGDQIGDIAHTGGTAGATPTPSQSASPAPASGSGVKAKKVNGKWVMEFPE